MTERFSYVDISNQIDGYSVRVINIGKHCCHEFPIKVHKSCPSDCTDETSIRIYFSNAEIKSVCDE